MTDEPAESSTPGEIEILIDGLTDDMSFDWALIHLGIHENPPVRNEPPDPTAIDAAFVSFERLVDAGLATLGRIERVEPKPAAGESSPPVRHVPEPMAVVSQRVERTCREAEDNLSSPWSCWLVNTHAGDVVARRSLETQWMGTDERARLK